MTPAATKGEKLFFLAAAVLAAAAALLAPASADASRYLPQALEPVTAPPASMEDLAAGGIDHHPALPSLSAADRLDLVDLAAGARLEAQRLGPHLAPGELGAARKTASGGQTWPGGSNVWLISEMGSKTLRHTFQGLWTDPVTGLSYARARWYDARNASWLSEDPAGAVDSPNLYAYVGWKPHMYTDPMGKCAWNDWECWGWVAGDFGSNTGHDLWNVASLGTLDRVEGQRNLGTLPGVGESMFQGARSISNTASFGLQESIYETQMREGPGVKSVLKGAGSGVVALTPYEEGKELVTNWGGLDTADRFRLGFTAVSKTASLGALGAGGARAYSAYQETGSLRGLAALRRAQLAEGGIGAKGTAGEAVLSEITPSGTRFQLRATAANGRPLRFSGRGRVLDAVFEEADLRISWESKNTFLSKLSGDTLAQANWEQTALAQRYLTQSRWTLWRGASPAAIEALTSRGITVQNFGPLLPAWQVLHPYFSVLPGMQQQVPGGGP